MQFSNSLPKCASTAAQRHLKSWCIVSLNLFLYVMASSYFFALTMRSFSIFWWRVLFSVQSNEFSCFLPHTSWDLCTSLRFYHSLFSQPYYEVGNRYNDGKISELEAVVVAHSSDFEKVKSPLKSHCSFDINSSFTV